VSDLVPFQSSIPAKFEELTKSISTDTKAIQVLRAAISKQDDCKDIARRGRELFRDLHQSYLALGTMLGSLEQKYESSGRGRIEKKKKLPPGITYKLSHYAQKIASCPEAIDVVLKRAEADDDIPSLAELLREIDAMKPSANPEADEFLKNRESLADRQIAKEKLIRGEVDNHGLDAARATRALIDDLRAGMVPANIQVVKDLWEEGLSLIPKGVA
jgi:hypothetical protein